MSQENLYTYIHFNRQNFFSTRDSLFPVDMGDISSKLRDTYEKMHAEAKQRVAVVNAAAPAAKELMSMIATSENLQELIEDEIATQVDKQINETRLLMLESYRIGSVLSKITDATAAAEKMNQYLSRVDSIINGMSQINEGLMNYYQQSDQMSKESLVKSFGKDLNILNINKTAVTSLQSLGQRAKLLSASTEGGTLSTQPISYVNSEGKAKLVSPASFAFSLNNLATNILGGLGEAVTALYAIKTADDLIMSMIPKGTANAKITVEGVGTTTTTSGKVSKSDVQISYDENNISLSFGISAKAKMLKENKSVITTFQTSKLGVFLNDVDKNLEYNFLNNLYQKRTSSNEQILLNRYLAAMNFDNAVTGVNIGDNVLFLSYLNKIIRIDEFYESLLTLNTNKLPFISLPSGYGKSIQSTWIGETKYEIKDLTPDQKSRYAWERSNAVRQALLSLSAQIQFST